MKPTELKARIENAGHDPHFFSRKTMKFFGDTMRNYRVRGPVTVETPSGELRQCWELYRKRPIKHGLRRAAYFDCATFARVSPKT